MTVKELIEQLKNCPQDAIVMYDFENAWINDDDGAYHFDRSDTPSEWHMPVDHVMIGNGTKRGFIYLTEDYIPE